MRILKIWDADYPWDIRVEKVATSLAASGHAVHLVCRNQFRRVRREWNGSFTVHRLPALPRVLGPVHTFWNFPYPLNPTWIHAIARVVRETAADLILVRDILLVVPAVMLGRARRIPVVLDMAENYPAMLRDRLRYTPTGWLDRLVRHPLSARIIEHLAIRLVDHIIVVVEESRKRMLKAGVPTDRLTVVCNTPPLDRWQPREEPESTRNPNDRTKLVYLGNLDGSRGIEVAIRAVRYLKETGNAASLTVIGDGPCREPLRALAAEIDVADQVTLTGRLPFSEVQSHMTQAHVGLIPHYATEAWNTTIPNKLFDCMLLGLPVIVSDAKPTARIVSSEGCGKVFHDRDDHDLARCIMSLNDPIVRQQMGRNGQAAVRRRYNWSCDSRVLIDILNRVRRLPA